MPISGIESQPFFVFALSVAAVTAVAADGARVLKAVY
jgi:hypothetical protein